MSEMEVVRRKVRYDPENSLVDIWGCVKCLFLVCLHCRAYCDPAANFSVFPVHLMKRKNNFGIRHWDVLLSLGDPQTPVKIISTTSSAHSYIIPEFLTNLQSYNLHQTRVVIALKATQPSLLTAVKLVVTFTSKDALHGAHSIKEVNNNLHKGMSISSSPRAAGL